MLGLGRPLRVSLPRGPPDGATWRSSSSPETALAPPAQSSLGTSGGVPASSGRSDVLGDHRPGRGWPEHGQHPESWSVPWGPGGRDCPWRVSEASQSKGSGDMQVVLGSAKAKHHGPAPSSPGMPTPWDPPKGPVFFVNRPVVASLASHSQGAFPEARDPYETFHTRPPTPTASAGTQPDP